MFEHAGADTVRRTLFEGAEPFRPACGSYMFRTTFHHVVAATRPNRP